MAKKKERHILGKGFIRIINNRVDLFGKQFAYIRLKVPYERIWCYCSKKCICKPWKLLIER